MLILTFTFLPNGTFSVPSPQTPGYMGIQMWESIRLHRETLRKVWVSVTHINFLKYRFPDASLKNLTEMFVSGPQESAFYQVLKVHLV